MPAPDPRSDWDAIVVAGGRATRLGGRDKSRWTIGGMTLVDRAIAAAADARRIAVVGPAGVAEPSRRVVVVREDPPYGGPAAAVGAGVIALAEGGERAVPWTVVLAVDLVEPTEVVARLLGALPSLPVGRDGVIVVDGEGVRQQLITVVRTAALLDRIAEHPDLAGVSMRHLLAGLDLAGLPVASAMCADVDTPDDALRLGVEPPDPPGRPA